MHNLSPVGGLVVLNPKLPMFLLEALLRNPLFLETEDFREEVEVQKFYWSYPPGPKKFAKADFLDP